MNESFHSKYRPPTLDKIIGHKQAVTRLKGMIESGNVPGAFLITGPSSAGKTTLARAFAVALNGVPIEEQQTDYKEINAAETRTIDDMRELIKLSKFSPRKNKRVFVIDEAQQLLTNAAAAQAILKPIEDAGATNTVWILCSMSPEKFGSSTGKAISNRCTQIVLEPPSESDLLRQAKRIVKAESLTFLNEEALEAVVQSCNGEYRTLANTLQALRDYHVGLGSPKTLASTDIQQAINSAASNDDALVVDVIVGALSLKYAAVHKALMNVADPFPFVGKLLAAAEYQLGNAVMEGARHPKLWGTPINKAVTAKLKGLKITLRSFAELQDTLVRAKAEAASFAVPETTLLSSHLYRFIRTVAATSNPTKT
jgi:DNA polymerase III delta prime subunit